MNWVRWLIVALSIVLVLALLAYARGDRQRGGEVEASGFATVVL